MATRGTITIIVKDRVLKTYNHFDSYLSGLGEKLLKDLKTLLDKYSKEELFNKVFNIVSIDRLSKPTNDDKKLYLEYSNIKVSEETLDDWYCLLYKTFGSLNLMIEGSVILLTHEYQFEDYNYTIDFNKDLFTESTTNLKLNFDDLPTNLNQFK